MFHRLGQSPLGGDDAFYSEVSKEMARTGDYLTTQNGYHPDFSTSKPPMLFWMNSLSGKILSFDTFAMRLPSAILGFAGVIAFMFFVSRYFDYYTGFLSALILTFTQQYMYHARSAVTDGPFAVFFAFTLMSFWIARTEKNNVFYYVMGLFLGLSVMTRQIPGFFILPVICLYILVSREFSILKNFHFYAGFFLSACVFVPWHLSMYLKYGNVFLTQYFNVTLMTAFKGYPTDYSSMPSLNPWYAYLQILVNNYWPWLPFLIAGVYMHIKKLGSYENEYRLKTIYFLLWAVVPLLIFQLAKVKQYHYIVPLYAPFALISATAFNGFREETRMKVTKWLMVIVACLTLSYVAFPIIPNTLDSREYIDTIKMVPAVKSLDGDLFTLKKGGFHYYNCLLFYADKKANIISPDEMIKLVKSPARSYFVVSKDAFSELSKSVDVEGLYVIQTTKDSILFRNNK
jgi:4-amino-4-deoxy-L-arabinose transferase-like glycosyltransferase